MLSFGRLHYQLSVKKHQVHQLHQLHVKNTWRWRKRNSTCWVSRWKASIYGWGSVGVDSPFPIARRVWNPPFFCEYDLSLGVCRNLLYYEMINDKWMHDDQESPWCVWVFDPYLALVGKTSINNLDCQVFVVARVNGNMLSLFSQSMLGSGQSCGMFIPRGDWNQPAANRCQFPHQCFACCSLNDAPPTFVTSNKPTPARSHPKVPFSDGLSFQLKQTWNKTVGSFSKLECTVFIDTIQYQYTKYSYTCYKRYSTVSNPPMLPDPRWAQTIPWDFGSRCRWPSRKWRTCYWEPPLSSLASMPLRQLVQVKLVEKHVFLLWILCLLP